MSSFMTLRFMDRIRNPGIVTLADRIETTFAVSSPFPAQPEVMNSAPKDAMIADTQRSLESLQEEFRVSRQKAEEDAQRQREHIETLYKELDESSEEVENCFVEIKDTLLRLDAAEDKANSLCAQADDDLRVAKEAHTLEISTLTGQLAEKHSLLSVARIALDDTKADLEAANTVVSILSADLSDKSTALSEAHAEVIETRVSLKVTEDKPCAEEATHQDSVTFADAKTLELSRELVQHDQLIAHLTECEEAALKDVARLEATNKDLNDGILTLEAQFSSAPSSDPIVSVDEISSESENVLAKNAVLESFIKAMESINADLTRAFEQECDAHDATRKMSSLFKPASLLHRRTWKSPARRSSRQSPRWRVAKSSITLWSRKSRGCCIDEQGECAIRAELEKENMTLRGLQSNLATLTGFPLSNVTNSSVLSPPVRAVQKKAGGSSWFNTGIFSPNASFR
ncbi:hypothetical protein NLI96_g7206 [Meripilus lineatus]|uniref:Uncharacterized protein n=1 Tax=Meripilus lineatus TaxID=2056292 RepID=A0AAD5UZL1_9APHY|nr:hypothetical protein NLI96_g7206 [Physisporinus lineatus]